MNAMQKKFVISYLNNSNMEQVAKELKISRSYVSRIEKRALTKLLREFIKHEKNT